jgi:LuxR family transcriptional regulator, quorum-sensing system regulator LasR
MLEQLRPGKVQLRSNQYIPPLLQSLVHAASQGNELLPYVESITRSLGFDSFMYGATASPKLLHDSKCYVYTTMPQAWIARYDQMAYIEVDPRMALTWESSVPLIWDQASFRGRGERVDAYLQDALAFGVGSGVCFLFHGPRDSHIFVALSAKVSYNDDIRLQAIARNLADILMFGHYFHDIFMRSVIDAGLAPRAVGAPLSKRERECLALAAHGMTTEDIAIKLEIRARTVQFHFDSIRTKLGAANRQEAIALAVQSGVVSAY